MGDRKNNDMRKVNTRMNEFMGRYNGTEELLDYGY
jgi:hypothetical protein